VIPSPAGRARWLRWPLRQGDSVPAALWLMADSYRASIFGILEVMENLKYI